ncbi:MAG TPA: VWA domain-containing protein [Vicinamibacterales bacterium]|jgi:VWFA-related protein
MNMTATCGVVLSMVVVCSGAMGAQQQATFKAGVDLVVVDVNAVDGRGHPIEGLQVGEFTIMVDGKPRRVVSATYVSYARPAPKSVQAEAAAPPARPLFSSNTTTEAPGRLVLILVDEGNIRSGSGQAVIRAASRFVDQLLPTDRVAIASIPMGIRVDVTANRAVIREALTRMVGRLTPYRPQRHVALGEAFEIRAGQSDVLERVVTRECSSEPDAAAKMACRTMIESDAPIMVQEAKERTRRSLAAIKDILRGLRRIDGPKTVLLISESIPLDDRGEMLSEITDVAAEASTARATVYGLRVDNPGVDLSDASRSLTSSFPGSADSDRQILSAGFETLVAASRGTIFTVVGQGDTIYSRIALEMSGYYLLGFEAEGNDRDGTAHRIDVKLGRKDVSLRARRQFVFTAETDETDEAAIARTLGSPFAASDLPVSITTFVVRDPKGSKPRLIIGADIDKDRAEGSPVAVGVAVMDRKGRVVRSFLEKSIIAPRHVPGPLAYMGAVDVEPGEYVVKLAARDKTGRRGSVEHAVNAAVARVGPLEVSDLLIADERTGEAGKWNPNVDGGIATPEFIGYLEIYSSDRAALGKARVTMEVSEEDQGPAVFSVALPCEAGEGRRVASGLIRIDLLPPGRYFAHAIVSAGDRATTRQSRPFEVLASASKLGTARAEVARAIPFSDTARSFQPQQVLAPEVLAPFLDRLLGPSGGKSLPSGVREAIDQARRGAFDAVLQSLPAGQDQLAVTFLRGLALLSRRDLERAAGEFRASLRNSVDFFPAALYLGACYAAGRRDREAIGAWQTTLAGENDLPLAYLMLFDALVRVNDWEQARDIAREAAGHWPEDAAVQRRSIAAWSMTGQHAEALAGVRSYLEKHGGDHEALFLAMRLVVQARGAQGGGSIDAAQFARYAEMYAAAKGPEQVLVSLWARHVARHSG